jgi:hypothetical protein
VMMIGIFALKRKNKSVNTWVRYSFSDLVWWIAESQLDSS